MQACLHGPPAAVALGRVERAEGGEKEERAVVRIWMPPDAPRAALPEGCSARAYEEQREAKMICLGQVALKHCWKHGKMGQCQGLCVRSVVGFWCATASHTRAFLSSLRIRVQNRLQREGPREGHNKSYRLL